MTDNEKMTKILGDIMTITDLRCLRTIQNTAFNRAKDTKQITAQITTASWMVNDYVQLLPEHRNRKPYGMIGKIKKINKVKMQVDFNGMIWNIPKSMLVKVG